MLKLLFSFSVWFLKYLKQVNKKNKISRRQCRKVNTEWRVAGVISNKKIGSILHDFFEGERYFVAPTQEYKVSKEHFESDWLEDVKIELRQAQETTNICSGNLTGTMDACDFVIFNNRNTIMKQVSSISIILMMPTLIDSLYEMNVPNDFEDNRSGI